VCVEDNALQRLCYLHLSSDYVSIAFQLELLQPAIAMCLVSLYLIRADSFIVFKCKFEGFKVPDYRRLFPPGSLVPVAGTMLKSSSRCSHIFGVVKPISMANWLFSVL